MLLKSDKSGTLHSQESAEFLIGLMDQSVVSTEHCLNCLSWCSGPGPNSLFMTTTHSRIASDNFVVLYFSSGSHHVIFHN